MLRGQWDILIFSLGGGNSYQKIKKKTFNISHTFLFMKCLTQSGYWGGYCLDDIWTGGRFCDLGGDYAWLNSAIYCISWGLTNYELGYGQYVYNGRGGVEGALNYLSV